MQSFPSGGSRSVAEIRSSSESEGTGWRMLRAGRCWHSSTEVVAHSGSLAGHRLPSPSADVALEGSALQLLHTGMELHGKQCSRVVNMFVK